MNIKLAIDEANNLKSKIDDVTMSQLVGLSSPKVRHLLNNLASQAKSYLEVGCYLGGTLRAALHDNSHVQAYAVDNFSMEPDKRQQFFDNTSMVKFEFFEQESFSIDLRKIKTPVELYFYDGLHTVEAQYKAVSYFHPILTSEFVLVVDDWDLNKTRVGTFTAIKDMGFTIIEQYELKGATGDSIEARHASWWGGIGILKVKKA